MLAASLAVTAVTTAVNYMGQKAQADAMYEAQVANNTALRNAAIGDMIQKGGDINARQQQEAAATALNINNQKQAARQAVSTAAATSESAGLSVEALMADYDRQYLNYADSQMQQLGFNIEQIQRTRESITAEAKNRINTGWDNRPITMPSLGGALLEIGAGAIGAYDKFSVRDPLTGKRTLN
jgi:hypothetical protein